MVMTFNFILSGYQEYFQYILYTAFCEDDTPGEDRMVFMDIFSTVV